MAKSTTLAAAEARRVSWERDGFFRVARFGGPGVCGAMLARVGDIARGGATGGELGAALVTPEMNLRDRDGRPEELVSKIFRLHRAGVFHDFAVDERVTDLLTDIL